MSEDGVGIARSDVDPLYAVQMPALAVRFGYGGLLIPGLVVAKSVKLRYARLPGVVAANVILGYGGL